MFPSFFYPLFSPFLVTMLSRFCSRRHAGSKFLSHVPRYTICTQSSLIYIFTIRFVVGAKPLIFLFLVHESSIDYLSTLNICLIVHNYGLVGSWIFLYSNTLLSIPKAYKLSPQLPLPTFLPHPLLSHLPYLAKFSKLFQGMKTSEWKYDTWQWMRSWHMETYNLQHMVAYYWLYFASNEFLTRGIWIDNESVLTGHEVDDDGVPKKYYFIQQLSKVRILQAP